MTKRKPNHLVKENSPYLLQHAYNPVDWHPWNDEALTSARTENKLLVISIGYAACHWCHVMEHESFEDEEVAEAMNRNFISIKVDREERPDIDHIYMAAAYTTTGRGGWPLNVIALPDQRPLFAGTYYAKRDWLQILKYFADQQNDHPEELIQHALEIEKGMRKQQFLPPQAESGTMDEELLHDVFLTWEHDLDFVHGGTHGAPKFPMPANIDFLLEYGQLDQNRKVLDYVELSLDKMAMGGIYDHLGGGFSRYSVDASWQVPHFEKMLYDNAQLISLYSHGYSVTRKYAFKKVVEESVTFIERELTSPEGLFYASLDADSEGEEGLFYGWTYEEIIKHLGDAPGMFLDYYSVEKTGNWENGLNILRKTRSDEEFAKAHGISVGFLSAYMDTCRSQLFKVRGSRIRPATDDKILTCWNALMISSLTDAARAFNKPVWLEKAVAAATFYRAHLEARKGKLWRNAKGGVFTIPGFLDDYCFLIKSFLDLYQSTLDETWLTSSEFLMREVLLHFSADDGVFFNLSSDETPDLIQKTVELSDNVIPSSNSQMARNLFVLGNLLVKEDYLTRSETMLKRMLPQIKRNPAFHSNWAALLAGFVDGPVEVKIIGDKATVFLKELSGYYLPRVVFPGDHGQSAFVENTNSRNMGKTLIYVCRDKTCFPPVESVHAALQYLGIQ